MEVTKRKYKKQKSEFKISVRHFINEKIKVNLVGGKIHSPLYVQVIAKQSTTYFKSRIETLLSPVELLNQRIVSDAQFQKILQREKENITKTTERLIKDLGADGNFHVSLVTNFYREEMANFGRIVRVRSSLMLCEKFSNEGGNRNVDRKALEFSGVHPMVLLSQWHHLPGISKLKNDFSSGFWNFDFYYKQFLKLADKERFVYASLEPIIEDYFSGNLKGEMLDFYSDIPETINQIFDDIERVFEVTGLTEK